VDSAAQAVDHHGTGKLKCVIEPVAVTASAQQLQRSCCVKTRKCTQHTGGVHITTVTTTTTSVCRTLDAVAATSGVQMGPGATALTLMFLLTSWLDRERVNASCKHTPYGTTRRFLEHYFHFPPKIAHSLIISNNNGSHH
jgi:hypothetical protein